MGQYEPQLLLSWSSCVGDIRCCSVGSMFCCGVGSMLLCGGIYPSVWCGIYMTQGLIQGGGGLWVLKNPPSPSYHLLQKSLSSLSPTFIISVHARFSMSDSFVDLPQEVVN